MTKTTLPAPHNIETESEFQIPAPSQIRWALKLLWLGFALSAVQYLWSLRDAVSVLPTDQLARSAGIFGLAVPIVWFIFDAYLNVKISHKKNWARVVKLILVAAGLFAHLAFSPKLSGFEYVSAGIVPALNFAALYLLFVTSGRLWFRQGSSRTDV